MVVGPVISSGDCGGVAGGSGDKHFANRRLTDVRVGQGTFIRLTGVETGTFGESTCGVSGILIATVSPGLEGGSSASSWLVEDGEAAGTEEGPPAEELPPPPAMRDLKEKGKYMYQRNRLKATYMFGVKN